MHIASTLISAAVGGAFGTGSGGARTGTGVSRDERDPERAVSAVR